MGVFCYSIAVALLTCHHLARYINFLTKYLLDILQKL